MRLAIIALALTSLVSLSSCRPPSPLGQWGDGHIILTISDTGGMAGAGCLDYWTIDSGWSVGSDGAFAGSGQHFHRTFVGDTETKPRRARYTGRLHREVVLPTLAWTDTSWSVSPLIREVFTFTMTPVDTIAKPGAADLFRDVPRAPTICM